MLFADDVVLLASSARELLLDWFAAECKAAGMRISISKSEDHGSQSEKGGMPSPSRGRDPALSGEVQVACRLVYE